MRRCELHQLHVVTYENGMRLQQKLAEMRQNDEIDDQLLLLEHPAVITLGRSGDSTNLLASPDVLRRERVRYFETTRGGDITYHGPGQIVGYPILNLAAIRRDVGWYVRMLEETMIRTTAEFAVVAGRVEGKTGIWVQGPQAEQGTEATEEKLGAIGVHISRWVTSHGFAYNVSTDLRYFDLIVPCGIAGRKATSLEKILDRAVSRKEVMQPLVRNFGEVFGLEMCETSLTELRSRLAEQPTAGEANLEHAHAVAALL